MEYPGTYFTRPWRIAFLLIFIGAFLIIAPLLVLYTSGYHYDFKNGIIKETGAISIDVLPKNATVYLNGEKLDVQMPIRLKNVTPAKYRIKISAAGFYDWEKDVQVDNMQTAYIKEIKLIQKSDPQKIIDGKIFSLYLSTDNNFLIYQKINTSTEFWLRDLSAATDKLILKTDNKQTYKIEWSNKNSFALIKNNDLSNIYVIDMAATNNLWNLSKDEKNITKIQWNNNSDNLYFSNKNQLWLANAATHQKTLVGKNYFIDWQPYNDQIWALSSDTTTNEVVLDKDVFGFASLFATINNLTTDVTNKTNWKITSVTDSAALLKKNSFSEMLLVTTDKQYNFFGEELLLSPYNNWWLMWTPWELTTYSAGEEPFLLNRSGEQLRKVIVLDRYNTLGLIWADKMTALFPYYFVSHNLINLRIGDAVADSQDRMLYFSGNINGQDGVWKMIY